MENTDSRDHNKQADQTPHNMLCPFFFIFYTTTAKSLPNSPHKHYRSYSNEERDQWINNQLINFGDNWYIGSRKSGGGKHSFSK